MAKYLVNVRRVSSCSGCGSIFGLLFLFMIGIALIGIVASVALVVFVIVGIVSLILCFVYYDGEPQDGTIRQKLKHLYNTHKLPVIGVVAGAVSLVLLIGIICSGTTSSPLSYEQKQAEQQEFVTYSNEATLSYEEYAALCGDYNYDEIIQNSENYKGTKIKTVGEVKSVNRDGNKFQLMLSNDSHSFYIKYYKYNDDETTISIGDIITAYGELDGLQEYQTTTGGNYMLPILNMVYWQLYN